MTHQETQDICSAKFGNDSEIDLEEELPPIGAASKVLSSKSSA